MHKSTKYLIAVWTFGFLLTVAVRVAAGNGVQFLTVLPESVYILGFILGLILLIGNILVTEFWMIMTERSKNEAAIRSAVRTVNWADVFFTAPGVFLVVICELILTDRYGGYAVDWVLLAAVVLPLVGVLWVAALIPMQNKLIRLSEQSRELNDTFYRLLHRWYWVGALANALSIIFVVLVVLQPSL